MANLALAEAFEPLQLHSRLKYCWAWFKDRFITKNKPLWKCISIGFKKTNDIPVNKKMSIVLIIRLGIWLQSPSDFEMKTFLTKGILTLCSVSKRNQPDKTFCTLETAIDDATIDGYQFRSKIQKIDYRYFEMFYNLLWFLFTCFSNCLLFKSLPKKLTTPSDRCS